MEKTEKFKIYNHITNNFLTKTPRISSRVKMVYTINSRPQNDQGKANQKPRKWWNMSVFSASVRFR